MLFRGGIIGLCAAALLAASVNARAQERGRTDGPEGSEIGAGGYESVGGGSLSLGLEWGAALSERDRGAPLFGGLNLGYWYDDWLELEGSAYFLARTRSASLLVGPKFRSATAPVSFVAGLKAGALIFDGPGAYFGISPQAGLDLELGRRALLGLGWAVDIPFGLYNAAAHRVSMGLSYRF